MWVRLNFIELLLKDFINLFVNIGFVCLFFKKVVVYNYVFMWIIWWIEFNKCFDLKLIYYGDCGNIIKIYLNILKWKIK